MEPDDPIAHLYDFFTTKQLKEIADHNTVVYNTKTKKLDLARAIITQTDGKYLIPNDLTPATKLYDSRVQALRGTKRKEHLTKKAENIKQQMYNAAPDEEPQVSNKVKRLTEGYAPAKDLTEKIAVYSKRNISWDSVGTLAKGYNYITRKEAEMWTRLHGVREATPEEIALHFDL